jgi:NAD(P)-dependent dehydrogenase (short-subunit alcohol dehydrogenase family)
MSARFARKVALVTGGTTGIGRATAVAFGAAGAAVVVAGQDPERGEALVDALNDVDADGIFVQTDVRNAASAAEMVDAAVARFGGLDFAFNNAGVDASTVGVADVSESEWDQVNAVNVKGVFLAMKYEIRAMLARGGGAIVNAASIMGLVGSANGALYAATKHAVVGLTRCAALDYARQGIRVNATAPGMIDTPMIDRTAANLGVPKTTFDEAHPIGRMGIVDEVAAAVLWLCSDEASFVTGSVLSVDGGMSAQ